MPSHFSPPSLLNDYTTTQSKPRPGLRRDTARDPSPLPLCLSPCSRAHIFHLLRCRPPIRPAVGRRLLWLSFASIFFFFFPLLSPLGLYPSTALHGGAVFAGPGPSLQLTTPRLRQQRALLCRSSGSEHHRQVCSRIFSEPAGQVSQNQPPKPTSRDQQRLWATHYSVHCHLSARGL